MNKILIVIIAILVVAGGIYAFTKLSGPEAEEIVVVNSFRECADAGYPVMESYPRQCKTPDGRTFTEDIGNEIEKMDLIRSENPRPNQKISSPLMVSGQARGYWFFEASFPVRLYDANGKQIALGIAQAQDEWMTEKFVPYKVTLEFEKPTTTTGVLVLEKDNPSGLPEHDDELRVPISFDLNANYTKAPQKPCMVTGCSSQVCADEEVVTTCEYDPQYACYKTAKCERQAGGECGWTLNTELAQCLGIAFE